MKIYARIDRQLSLVCAPSPTDTADFCKEMSPVALISTLTGGSLATDTLDPAALAEWPSPFLTARVGPFADVFAILANGTQVPLFPSNIAVTTALSAKAFILDENTSIDVTSSMLQLDALSRSGGVNMDELFHMSLVCDSDVVVPREIFFTTGGLTESSKLLLSSTSVAADYGWASSVQANLKTLPNASLIKSISLGAYPVNKFQDSDTINVVQDQLRNAFTSSNIEFVVTGALSSYVEMDIPYDVSNPAQIAINDTYLILNPCTQSSISLKLGGTALGGFPASLGSPATNPTYYNIVPLSTILNQKTISTDFEEYLPAATFRKNPSTGLQQWHNGVVKTRVTASTTPIAIAQPQAINPSLWTASTWQS